MNTVAPAQSSASAASVTPGFRPALVNGQRIFLQCPAWCIEDHVAENARHLEDVCHSSAAVDLMSPRDNGPARLLAYARVISGDYGSDEDRRPQVTVDFDDIHGMYLHARDADEFADNLITFALEVRALARTARGA